MTTPREQRMAIVAMADSIHREDRMAVLRVLKQHTAPIHIVENADGSRVNLDILPDSLVKKIHHIMSTRLAAHQFDAIPGAAPPG